MRSRSSETRPQFGLQHLARGVTRQCVDDLQALGVLVAREPLAEELIQILDAQAALRDGGDRDRHFTPLLMWTSDYRDFHDLRVTGEDVLHFGAVDILDRKSVV